MLWRREAKPKLSCDVICSLVNAVESNPAERSRVLQSSGYMAYIVIREKKRYYSAQRCADALWHKDMWGRVHSNLSGRLPFITRLCSAPSSVGFKPKGGCVDDTPSGSSGSKSRVTRGDNSAAAYRVFVPDSVAALLWVHLHFFISSASSSFSPLHPATFISLLHYSAFSL